jgi:hypothetical protein
VTPADLATLQTIVTDVDTGLRVIQALASFAGYDAATVLRIAGGPLPPLVPAGPDVSSEYEAAREGAMVRAEQAREAAVAAKKL